MNAVTVHSAILFGIESVPMTITALRIPGDAQHQLQITGLLEHAEREMRVKVLSSLAREGVRDFGHVRVTIEPTRKPATTTATLDVVPGSRASCDLAVALAVLGAIGKVKRSKLDDVLVLGELSLEGDVRGVRGILAHLRDCKLPRAIVPGDNVFEAGLLPVQTTYAAHTLLHVFTGVRTSFEPADRVKPFEVGPDTFNESFVDPGPTGPLEQFLRDVMADRVASRVLVIGAPGCGATIAARALSRRLPVLTDSEMLETIGIESAAGILGSDTHTWRGRPFRAPHHTVSEAGMAGGGVNPRPGEVSLATHGVLLLDEVHEFRKVVLEATFRALKQNRADFRAGLARTSIPAVPAYVIGRVPPCRCGYQAHPRRGCECTTDQLNRWQETVIEPLTAHFDRGISLRSA